MTFENQDISVLLAIGAAAAITYSLRLGGLLLSDKLPDGGKFKKFMDALPGAILLSLIAPGIAAAGVWGCFAAFCTALCTWRTKNLFLAMMVGISIVAFNRQFFH